MKLAIKPVVLFALVAIFAAFARGQALTGTPPFGSISGGPIDTIDLGNLNIHLSIPIVTKAGRGGSFSYNLGYDTSVLYPGNYTSGTAWTLAFNNGWTGPTQIRTGAVTVTSPSFCTTTNERVYITTSSGKGANGGAQGAAGDRRAAIRGANATGAGGR